MRVSTESVTEEKVLPLVLNRDDMMATKYFRYTNTAKYDE